MGEVEAGVAVNSSSAAVTAFSDGRTGFRSLVTAFRCIELLRGRVPYDRIEPVCNIHWAAGMFSAGHATKCWSNTDQSAERCQDCQRCEGNPHRRWRLVWKMRAVMLTVAVSRDVMRHVLVYWSNVLARLMSRTIAG